MEKPAYCWDETAWLGLGFYFWTDPLYAKYWGADKKMKRTGAYDVYKAHLDITNCIDTVFDEKGYFFFEKKIDETVAHLKSIGAKISLQKVHEFLADNIWPKLSVTGIIYADTPTNSALRTHSAIPDLYYKKRIQVVMFQLAEVVDFQDYLIEQTK